jgi:hypothetical protein
LFAGWSFGSLPLVLISTKTWRWEDTDASPQNDIVVHELAHQFAMVPPAPNRRSKLDRGPKHYDTTQGHVGNHCYQGNPAGVANYQTSPNARQYTENSTCVMWGQQNGVGQFCPDCEVSIRKADITRST